MDTIDSKALFTCFIKKIPALLILAVTGALTGSGLHLIIALIDLSTPVYVSETEYYIDFAEGRLEAKDYYNDFTWNDVIATDLILGKAMTVLGDGYEREQVKNTITADILSDVRYLTITIEHENAEDVEKIRDALQFALESFGDSMEEFDAIAKIEDLGVVQREADVFAWRAALLGALILFGIGIFMIAFRFSLGDCIYTKTDIVNYFELPVYGLLYSKNNDKDGRQEKMLIAGIRKLSENARELFFAEAAESGFVQTLLQELEKLEKFEAVKLKKFDSASARAGTELIMVIPFGVPCRRVITDEINQLRQQGYSVVGAVLVNVDKSWMDIYFGKWNG